MNSAEGYYYDYEGVFLGGPYKGSSKVKICKYMSKEAGIVKGKKITYDSFHDPLDLNIEYDDFLLLSATNFGESSQYSEYNTVLSKDRKSKKHFVLKNDSFQERLNIVQCCLSYADLKHSGCIYDAIMTDKNYTYAKGHKPFKDFKATIDDKRNDNVSMKISIKASIQGILSYRKNKKNGLIIATHWDGVDVIENWNNPHERNRAGTIDIEGNYSNYINYLLVIDHPNTGLKNCYAEVEKIKKKYDSEIEEVKKIKKATENEKQKHIAELERRKNIFANFEEIKNKEVAKKIKEMRESTKGKQLSTKEDCVNKETKVDALKKGYLTIGHAGGSIIYLEHQNPNFKGVIENQLGK